MATIALVALGVLGVKSVSAILSDRQRHADGFDVELPGDWMQGRTAFGGLSSALALQGALDLEPDLPPLRSAQIAFIGPLSGKVRVTATKLRRGRNAAFIQADVTSEAGLGLRATFVFMAALPSAVEHAGFRNASEAPPPPGTPVYIGPENFFTNNFEFFDLKEGLAPAEWRRWGRLREREQLSAALELILLGDALPPGALRLFNKQITPVSSLSWQINFLNDAAHSNSGWWLLGTVSDYVADGFSTQRMMLWDDAGAPVVEAIQGVAVFG